MLRLPRMVGTFTLVGLWGCLWAAVELAATPSATGETPPGPGQGALACPEPGEPPSAGGGRPNEELMLNETFQRAATDVLRLGIAVRFCELRPDTLTLDLGEEAFTSASTEYNLSRLHAAYRPLTEFRRASVLELRYEDRVVGWHTGGGLTWTDKPAPRRPPPAEAQPVATVAAEPAEDAPRTGFHFSAGVGAGAFDQQCAGCEFDSEVGVSAFLALGGLINRQTAVGVEATGWTKDESGIGTQVYSAMAQMTRYASETSGLFLRAGVGLVGLRSDGDFSAAGPGFVGRLGYEFGRGKVHILPYVGYIRSFDGLDLKRDGDDAGLNFVISQLQFGLGVSIY